MAPEEQRRSGPELAACVRVLALVWFVSFVSSASVGAASVTHPRRGGVSSFVAAATSAPARLPLLLAFPRSGRRRGGWAEYAAQRHLHGGLVAPTAAASATAADAAALYESRPGGSGGGDETGRTLYRPDVATDSLTLSLECPSGAPTGAGRAGAATGKSAATSSSSSSSSLLGLASLLGKVKRLLRVVFLPVGWPHSVAPEYLRFQSWNVVQDLSTYLRGILSTQAILEGMGVGRAGATPLAATIQWITRDGASMISGLVFTSLSSSNFGVNAKSWRLFADFIVDVGITLDMLAPLFPQHFLHCICLASVCKSLCGISAGASNGAITQHFAQRNNLAEVLAKGGAQHTAVSLMGLGFGFWFARFANASPRRVWTAYVLLTALHLVANYAAMRVLAFKSLNRRRLDVVLHDFLLASSGGAVAATAAAPMPSPAQVARKEVIIAAPFRRDRGPRLRLGARVKDLTTSARELAAVQAACQGEAYLLNARGHGKRGEVVVALREDATNLTLIKACLHAYLYHRRRREAGADGDGADATQRLGLLEATHMEANELFPALEEGLRGQGWDLDCVLLSPEGWVYHDK